LDAVEFSHEVIASKSRVGFLCLGGDGNHLVEHVGNLLVQGFQSLDMRLDVSRLHRLLDVILVEGHQLRVLGVEGIHCM